MVEVDKCMWLLRSLWPVTTGPCSAEGTRPRKRLTGKPREWYAQIPEDAPLIRQEGENWGSLVEMRKRGDADSGIEVLRIFWFFGMKRPEFWGSRNNSG